MTDILLHLDLLVEKRAKYMYLLRQLMVLLPQVIQPQPIRTKSYQQSVETEELALLQSKLDERIVKVLPRIQPFDICVRDVDRASPGWRIHKDPRWAVSIPRNLRQ